MNESKKRDIVKKYAEEIERTIEKGDVGDYTWEAILLYFLEDIEAIEAIKKPIVSYRNGGKVL